ncbi:PREDICTED: sporulation-specific protein 15-like [Fragaria vesca subsp. vesca]|uniref:sporulation-specific protein 15-like n=1 Tax=Fragaria vesca subsp. vesca TaxID=101020 RepID=UPI0002C31407|nr:PREDICTED: sporulation-specific protein 15-like [Fragaria vesca subsp. vesca]
MFRIHRNRPAKSGERIDFKFSQFKAVQVPRGWDKLFVSIVSVETGKPIAKSSKAVVRNGSCQWSEALSESIWISQDDNSKEMEDCFFKLVVAMGSARSGILGEATVNMSDYITSSSTAPVSLPLKKCNYGTVLQVKINCLKPRARVRDVDSKETSSFLEEQNASGNFVDGKSDGSDSTSGRSLGSSSTKDFGLTSNPGEPGSRGSSFSAVGSHCSYESVEGSVRRGPVSPESNLSGEGNLMIGRQDSTGSQTNSMPGSFPAIPYPSNHSSFNSRITGSGNHSQNSRKDIPGSPLRTTGSSKNLLETAEVTIEELHAEAKMWERNARKLMLDLDILKAEFSDQSKKQANLNMELSAAYAERDSLKKEVEHLKVSFGSSAMRQTGSKDLPQVGVSHIEKALQDELKFQKESIANLDLQLKRSQESNIELVSILQELEETIEEQKMELENLLELQSKFSEMENSIQITAEENSNLTRQLQKLQESENKLQDMVQQLEQALDEKNCDVEKGSGLEKRSLSDIEMEYRSTIFDKEEEIIQLKEKLSESLKETHSADMGSITMNGGETDLVRQIEVLKEKLHELETDCNELTQENLELLFKLKEAKNISAGGHAPVDLPTTELLMDLFTSSESKVTERKSYMKNAEENCNKMVLGEITNNHDLSVQVLESLKMELEIKVTDLEKELTEKRTEIAKLEDNLLTKEEETGVLRQVHNELEAQFSDLQREKVELEEHMEIVLRESELTTKCLNDLRNDLVVLSSSVDTHVSTNKILEKKSSELEADKHELELHLSELQQQNTQLSEQISAVEVQLRCLTDEKEANRLELENSKSYSQSLQDEISTLKVEMESDKVELKQKLVDLQSQWSEAREECEFLKRENPKLQASIETLIEECNLLQKSNEELRTQKLELHEQSTHLEARLTESQERFEDCSRRVEVLEQDLCVMMESIASKEKILNSELDALRDESIQHWEELMSEQSLLNKMYLEKEIEAENLQQEVEQLTKQLSEIHKGSEELASGALQEASRLRAEKVDLECALQEVQSRVIQAENELNIMRTEYEEKLQGLSVDLTASKQLQETMMADHERLLRLLENYKSSEAKLKTAVNNLELKLTVSDYEQQQLVEESTNLKVQLQNLIHCQDQFLAVKKELDVTKLEKEKLESLLDAQLEKLTHCQDQVLAIKTELEATKLEKEKSEELLDSVSEEYEYLKAEKNSFLEKISTLDMVLSELEDCKHNKAVLERKILQMKGDLIAKEALCAQDAELKNELNQFRRANEQYQQKLQLLEEEKDVCRRRSQSLEQELKLIREEKPNQRDLKSRSSTKVTEDKKLSKSEMVKNTSHRRDNRRKPLVKNDKDDNGIDSRDGSPRDVTVDHGLKIKMLEDELVKAMEANNTYKLQLDRLVRQNHADAHQNSKAEVVAKDRFERSKSSLETELKEIRERYLSMSLRYAEVEAEREELVMKLKQSKSGKKWF